MSHIADVNLRIDDLDAIEAACDRLGLELVRDQKQFAWWGTWLRDSREADAVIASGIKAEDFGKCAHAIRVKGVPGKMGPSGPYEIGLVRNPNGNGDFVAIYDNIGGGRGLEAKAGKALVELKREYASEVSMRHLVRQGYQVERRNVNGEIKILATQR